MEIKKKGKFGLIIPIILALVFLGGLIYCFLEYKELKSDNLKYKNELKNNEKNLEKYDLRLKNDFGNSIPMGDMLSIAGCDAFIGFKNPESVGPFDPYLYFGNMNASGKYEAIGQVVNEQNEKLSIYLVLFPIGGSNINGILLFDDNGKIYIINDGDLENIQHFEPNSKLTAKLYNNKTVKTLSITDKYVESDRELSEEGYYYIQETLNINYSNNSSQSIGAYLCLYSEGRDTTYSY